MNETAKLTPWQRGRRAAERDQDCVVPIDLTNHGDRILWSSGWHSTCSQDEQKHPEQGLRFNDGKLRYDLLEPHAIEELVRVFTTGAAKYEPHNYLKGMAWSKCQASLKRHLAAWEKREDRDDETGHLHMAHVAWNALALVSYALLEKGEDDRLPPKSAK